MHDTRDAAIRDYLDAIHKADSAHEAAAFMALLDRVGQIEFSRGYTAGSNQTTDVFDKIFNVLGPKVPMVFPRAR